MISTVTASTLRAGADVQAAVDKAISGDTIIVGPGQYNPFEVDKPLRIIGVGWPVVQAAVQTPGITISSDGTLVFGFRIKGVPEASTSKFDYYMQHSATTALRLDLPDAGILVRGNNVAIQSVALFGAQVGVYADDVINLSIVNATFDRCGTGAQLLNCRAGQIGNCRLSGCDKSGIDVEQSSDIKAENNSISDTNNSGILLKESTSCSLSNNTASGNKEGIVLWNSTLTDVSHNRADHSYYGILASGSNNNTILDNVADDNSRNENIKGFGIGISLQENSSHNIIARNTASRSFNGLELIRGCRYNVVYSNNATDNTHGIRVDKNYNNLIYHNNFVRNTISAYDNSTHNFWNASVGNYYSDYRGTDEDGDGIGDQPYVIPMGNTKAVDARPLIKPCSTVLLNMDELKMDLLKYARYDPEEENNVPYRRIGSTIVIGSKMPTSPPEWPDSKPLLF
jgi:nitrous oxidase accessory protein